MRYAALFVAAAAALSLGACTQKQEAPAADAATAAADSAAASADKAAEAAKPH